MTMGRSANLKEMQSEFCGRAGFMLLASVLLQLLNSSALFSIPIYSAELANYYAINIKSVAILGILQATVSLTAPLTSVLVQKYGCRPVCCVGGILTATGFVISAFTPQYSVLYFSFAFISGIGYMLISLVAETTPQLWFDRRRYLVAGISRSALAVGYFIWTPILRLAIDTYSWKGAALLQGGILLNTIVIAQVLRQHSRSVSNIPHHPLPLNAAPRQLLQAQSASRRSPQSSLRISNKNVENGNGNLQPMYLKDSSSLKFSMFTYKLYRITGCSTSTFSYDTMLLIGCTLVLIGYMSSLATLTMRAESLGIESNRTSVFMPLYIALSVVCRVIFGYLGDVWFVKGIVLSGIGAGLSGLFCMMSDAMTSFPEQCIFVVILAITQAMYESTWPAVFVDIFGTPWKEFAVSIFVFCASLAKILSPVITEWLISETNDFNTPYVVLGAFQIIAGGLIAAICLIRRFFSELQVTNVKEQSDESVDDSLMLRRTPPSHVRAPVSQDEEWRDRAGSNVSQLKEFYPL